MPCTRCLRIRHPCFTSSAKPPGRGFGRSNRKKAIQRRANQDVSLALDHDSHMSMGWPFIHNEEQNEGAEIVDDGGISMNAAALSDEPQPLDLFDFFVDKNPLGFDTVPSVPFDAHASPASHSRLYSVPQSFFSASPPSDLPLPYELDDEHDGAVHMVGEDPLHMLAQSPTQPFQSSPGVLLAQLSESLSVQLVRLHTRPWDLGVLSVTCLTTNSGEDNATTVAKALTDEVPIFNPLLPILVSTGKFLDICKSFVSPESIGRANEASAVPAVAGGSVTLLGPRGGLFSMHDMSESRREQETTKRAGRPGKVPPPPLPFSFTNAAHASTLPRSRRGTGSRSSFSSTGSPPGRTIITAAQLLTVVSCYLQIVVIYNDVFSHLLFQLTLPSPQSSRSTQHSASIGSVTSETITASSQHRRSHDTQQAQPATHGGSASVPNLILAGYSVPLDAGLRMRLLVEVVEHQFEQIEHVLGLPDPYCVSRGHQQQSQQQRHDSEGALLAGREVTTLLEAAMDLSISMDRGGAAAGHDIGHDSARVFASLRENFGKAQRVRRSGSSDC